MLVLTRKPGQGVTIDLVEGIDPRTPVGELFGRGPIWVEVVSVNGSQVRLGFEADSRLRILREELCSERVTDGWLAVRGR